MYATSPGRRWRQTSQYMWVGGCELHQTCGRAWLVLISWREKITAVSVGGCGVWRDTGHWTVTLWSAKYLTHFQVIGMSARHRPCPSTLVLTSPFIMSSFAWCRRFDNPGLASILEFHEQTNIPNSTPDRSTNLQYTTRLQIKQLQKTDTVGYLPTALSCQPLGLAASDSWEWM